MPTGKLNFIQTTSLTCSNDRTSRVSDLVWLDEADYDPKTGANSVGVEFGGTAVSSSGFGGTIASATKQSSTLVRDNMELQWQEGYYRGYFELQISPEQITANYFGCPTVASQNPYEISLANFTVKAGDNRLARPVAGGVVQSGVLQSGKATFSNLTYDTSSGKYLYTNFSQMVITYPKSS
jgi:alkaline phosphatase D